MSAVKWSSPIRLAGSTPLNPIPNEIYHEIFDHFTPKYAIGLTKSECKHALSNLALVCRFFCAMALPRIFKSIKFSGSLFDGTANRLSYAPFCRAVIKGQEPAASVSLYVTECKFKDWRRRDEELRWAYNGFLRMYGQAMGRMSNLQSVILRRVDIDKRLLKTICELKSVQSLSIDDCSLVEDIKDTIIQKLTPLKLKSFSHTSDCENPLQAEIFARIVDTSNLEKLEVNDWAVARNIFMQFGKESSLVELVLYEARDDPTLWKVLELSNAMKNIRIWVLSGASSSTGLLSPSSMPQLCILQAPAVLASALVPGRPLHTVVIPKHLCPSAIDRVAIDGLEHSTIPIRVLEIPSCVYPQIQFDKLPQMKVLQLSYRDDHIQDRSDNASWLEDVLRDLAQKWHSTPPLRELYFAFYLSEILKNKFFMDLELHHKIIVSHLAGAFPSINIFSLVYFVHWRKDYRTKSWIPSVPVEHRNALLNLSRKGELTGFRDFNGCLEAVLSSSNPT